MRNLKKVLALVIAFSMMLSAVAFAGYQDVAVDADYAGAVELLSALGIFEGDENGNFNPDKTVSRAEMAAIICRATGVDAAAQTATDYSDVPASHWASGYIAHASDAGILNGVGGGLFNPAGTLTYQQALKIVVYALGFEPMAEDNGGWSAGSIYVANRYKITEGADSTATRGNLAVILANAMKTPMMDKTSYGSDSKSEVLNGKNDKEYRTLLTDMDIYIATGVVGAKDVDEIDFDVTEDSDDGEFVAKKDDTNEETFKIADSDIALYQNQNVDAYVKKVGKKYEVVAVVANAIGETFELLSDDIEAVTVDGTTGVTTIEYYVDAANSNKTKEIEVAKVHTVEYNKGAASKTLKDFDGAKDVELQFIENNGDGEYDYVVATAYISDRVDYVDADRDRLSIKNEGRTINFDFEDEEATIILVDEAGNALTLADFAKDDVVAIVASNANPANYNNSKNAAKYIKVVKLSNAAVTGTVESTYTSNGVYYAVINGEEYATTSVTSGLAAGDEGTFYVGLTGKLIDFDGSLVGDNYAYILEGAIAQGSFTSDQWQLKLLTKDGVVTYDIKKEYHATVVKYLADNAAAFGLTQVKGDNPETKDTVETDFVLDVKETKFIFDTKAGTTSAQLNNKARLITFEANSKGEIKEIAMASATIDTFDKASDEFDAGKQDIKGASLEDDVVIFNVAGSYASDAYATDISYLVDEAKYTGFTFEDADGEYSVMVVTDLESAFNAANGLAIATRISLTTKGDEEVTEIDYVQGETEGTLILNDDSEAKGKDSKIEVGTAFVFTADAEGVVGEYLVVASIKDNKIALASDGEAALEAALTKGNDKADIKVGYIMNTKRDVRPKGELINLGGSEVVVPSSANKYTYNTFGRNVGDIELSDFMYDGDYAADDKLDNDTEEIFACPILVFEFDKDVIDVYSTNARIDVTPAE